VGSELKTAIRPSRRRLFSPELQHYTITQLCNSSLTLSRRLQSDWFCLPRRTAKRSLGPAVPHFIMVVERTGGVGHKWGILGGHRGVVLQTVGMSQLHRIAKTKKFRKRKCCDFRCHSAIDIHSHSLFGPPTTCNRQM
jgi:hypothetical protein